MTNLEVVHAVFDAAEKNDFKLFRSLFTDDAVVWHNFDDHDQPVDETIARLKELGVGAVSREYIDRRYVEIAGGAVAQHTVRRLQASGEVVKIFAMARIYITSGKISRIEEYLAVPARR
jgi:ketosteroid isomerase-like protein